MTVTINGRTEEITYDDLQEAYKKGDRGIEVTVPLVTDDEELSKLLGKDMLLFTKNGRKFEVEIPDYIGANVEVSQDHSKHTRPSLTRTDSANRMQRRQDSVQSENQSTRRVQRQSRAGTSTI